MTSFGDLLDEEFDTPEVDLAFHLAQEDHHLLAKLVAERERQGLTQEQLGERIGLTQATISAFEKLGNDPHMSTVRRYARALGVMIRHQFEPEVDLDHCSHSLTHLTETGMTTTETASAAHRSLRKAELGWPHKATGGMFARETKALA